MSHYPSLAALVLLLLSCRPPGVSQSVGFAELHPVVGLTLNRPGHAVLRSATEYDNFLARYWRPSLGLPAPLPRPQDFQTWAVVVVSTSQLACVALPSDIGGLSYPHGLEADTQLVIVAPARSHPYCRRYGDRVEALWVRQRQPVVLFTTAQVNEDEPPPWVTTDLMGGPVACGAQLVTADSQRIHWCG